MASFHFTNRNFQRLTKRTTPHGHDIQTNKSVFPLNEITTQHIPPYASLSAEDRETKEDLQGFPACRSQALESREGD